MAARSRAPAIGSAHWILDERHQSNDLVSQEQEDFGFSVRNELEWLNEHMTEIFAHNGQSNLDVFKTPGKLRGKTPHTARKRAAENRQPLADLIAVNAQKRTSPAEQSLQVNLHKNLGKARFQIAEDSQNDAPVKSPMAKSPAPQALFSALLGKGKENAHGNYAYGSPRASPERRPGTGHSAIPVHFSPLPHSTQDTAMTGQDEVFSQPQTQSTQATQSFERSINSPDKERRETGDSFVSAKEAFAASKTGFNEEDLHANVEEDGMDVDDDKPDDSHSSAQDTVVRHEISSSSVEDGTALHHEIPDFPQPPQRVSDAYSISADTHEAFETAYKRAHAPEPKSLIAPPELPGMSARAVSEDATQQDGTVVHHIIEDQMDMDDDARSTSDGSSPAKPPVRKSSLTFASLPARQPLLAKKSMGDRISRTSHIDQNKARASNLGRFTGGKSLGGSQLQQTESQNNDQHDEHMDTDNVRPELLREESETTKIHNKTSSQRLLERINMLKQKNEAPVRASQHILSHTAQAPSSSTSEQSQPKEVTQAIQPVTAAPVSQPAYPSLPANLSGKIIDDDEDDWISPIRTTAPAPTRPAFSKSHSANTRPAPSPIAVPKPVSVSNPADLSTVVESTTPAGSPTGKKYTDGPLSASKAKFYSALRAAKDKIVGSGATTTQNKLDALSESPVRPLSKQSKTDSSDDVFSSPKRNEKAGTSFFSHLRSPSKESLRSNKPKVAAMAGSPTKEDNRRTRSSSERERQKDKDVREKELKQKQRTDDKLKEMRDKESKAAAQYQKTKASFSKTPAMMASQQNLRQAAALATKTPSASAHQSRPRPGTNRTNTADSTEDMPPPPPPKSFLPTTGHKLREAKKLVKVPSKTELAKSEPQKIMVNLKYPNSNRYGQAPPPPSRHAAPSAPVAVPSVTSKPAPAPKMVPTSRPGTAASNRGQSAFSKSGGPPKSTSGIAKTTAPRAGRPQQPKVAEKPVEKPKTVPAPAQPRSDLAAARPVDRMREVQEINRIKVPPMNTAKPPVKRPFQPENDEALHRPAKRPSQQAKMNPVTPAHAQFAKGKIPFAESIKSTQPAQPQYQDGNDIELPACVTDSEDDSDAEGDSFEQPSWVNTPNLHQLLTQQQLVDPETIFGPIAPLNMEAVFPDNKEKHKRFRQRTSSAYWANDQVTDEEKRKEREARERLVKEGAWTYNPSPLAPPRPER
ncbi:hypothetical protein P280DRAFT_548078 [Massarina eburnea CBS 473.64]|uniref:Inner centromere protein ARK-binding domain-containing protein n=1 Tax=Massarina eburnea CBS 473.64 TaxID=1395130 RepID=A0A6A6S618_9PLEO|nr:hypothetical protein P280DRAFT_548078 [Massarina eburnea CBS 473.64]